MSLGTSQKTSVHGSLAFPFMYLGKVRSDSPEELSGLCTWESKRGKMMAWAIDILRFLSSKTKKHEKLRKSIVRTLDREIKIDCYGQFSTRKFRDQSSTIRLACEERVFRQTLRREKYH